MERRNPFLCRCERGFIIERQSWKPDTRGQLYYACPDSVVNNHMFAYLCKYVYNLFVKNKFLIIFLTCNSQVQITMGVDTSCGKMNFKRRTLIKPLLQRSAQTALLKIMRTSC